MKSFYEWLGNINESVTFSVKDHSNDENDGLLKIIMMKFSGVNYENI
jgi:hypothetical protein